MFTVATWQGENPGQSGFTWGGVLSDQPEVRIRDNIIKKKHRKTVDLRLRNCEINFLCETRKDVSDSSGPPLADNPDKIPGNLTPHMFFLAWKTESNYIHKMETFPGSRAVVWKPNRGGWGRTHYISGFHLFLFGIQLCDSILSDTSWSSFKLCPFRCSHSGRIRFRSWKLICFLSLKSFSSGVQICPTLSLFIWRVLHADVCFSIGPHLQNLIPLLDAWGTNDAHLSDGVFTEEK